MLDLMKLCGVIMGNKFGDKINYFYDRLFSEEFSKGKIDNFDKEIDRLKVDSFNQSAEIFNMKILIGENEKLLKDYVSMSIKRELEISTLQLKIQNQEQYLKDIKTLKQLLSFTTALSITSFIYLCIQ